MPVPRRLLPALFAFAAAASLAAADYAWLEGEAPVAMPATAKAAQTAHSEYLSGGSWLLAGVEAGEVDAKVPGEGIDLAWRFEQAAAGKRELWARIGFEFVRSPFRWRLDGGAWSATVGPKELTTDLMELGTWNEIAWLKLGEADLAAGAHGIDLQVLKTRDGKGKSERILFALDALCVAAPGFHPNGRNQPGSDGRDEADRKAGEQVFRLAAPAGAAQTELPLAGTWEICRDDEAMPLADPATPIAALPAAPVWKAIAVPGDKNTLRHDLVFAHRVWYRTRIEVPAAQAGRSFHLVFPANCLNTTVWVNGAPCGFDKNPLAQVRIDVSKAMRPGLNEVWVGIRDAWYGRSFNPGDPLKLRATFNLPPGFFSQGFQELAYPIWANAASGIISTPRLVAGGPVYTADAFCQPSVGRKELAVELTLRNPGVADLAGEAVCEAVDDATGAVALTMPAAPFAAKAGGEVVVKAAAPWADPVLWWPDQPHLYRLRTTLTVAGRAVDAQEVVFGFREWTADGINFRLNGVRWQGFNEQGNNPATAAAWLKDYRANNYTVCRLWPEHGGTPNWYGLEPAQALDFFDRNGVVVRRSDVLDGEGIGYMAIERDPAMQKVHGSQLKADLLANWRDHLVARVKGERNHPSVMVWSIENEFLYINCINLYAGLMDQFETEIAKTAEAVRAVDPTRFTMVDGGGATRAGTLPVHGDHYTTEAFGNYPALAYEPHPKGGGRGRWEWDQKRPRFIGEELFAAGINPAYAYFGGEQVFLGKAGNRPAVGTAMRILSEGYRWAGIGAVDFCQGSSDADGSHYNSWAPRAVLCRQWDWSFAAGQQATRTFAIFNATRFADPIAFTRSLVVDGKPVWSRTTEHAIAPGGEAKFDEALAFPAAAVRREGELVLTLAVKGKEVFRAVKPVSILPEPARPAELAKATAADLHVYDPAGTVVAQLKRMGIPCTVQERLAPPAVAGKTWLIGKDALGEADADSTACAAYAVDGGRVIVLEQANPLRYQALGPAEIETDRNEGRIAFGEDFSHPLLRGLADKDFFTWEASEVVWRNAYRKPSHGARSLVQCNESLTNTALAVVPVGSGVLVLSQLLVEEKLPTHAVPRHLLANLLAYAAAYRQEFAPVAACAEPALAAVLDDIALQRSPAADPLAALAVGRVAVVSATPANLKALAGAKAQVEAFAAAGGHLILHGLTPEGLADYDRLVGVEHLIRPFRRERVALAAVRDPLLAGVTQADVALYSTEKIFPWQSGCFVADDTFSYIVDLDDVAPFAKLNNDWYLNLVGGMGSADGWKYICNHASKDREYIFTLPRAEELTAITWAGNAFYNRTTGIEVVADGDEAGKRSFAVDGGTDAQTLAFAPPLKGQKITVRHAMFEDLPGKSGVIGCDNIRLTARRAPGLWKPLLNLGGLVLYPRGQGGILLCNLRFKDHEAPAENGTRKRNVLAAILRNLKAPFAGGRTVVAGAHLAVEPIDLSKQANIYRNERGWFGDPKRSLKDLPTGDQTFAGVRFNIFEFPTSPVPTAIALRAKGLPDGLPEAVEGIAVNRKADALFFLHTARLDQRRTPQEAKEGRQFVMARYVVTWADGRTADIPLLAEIDIDHWIQARPAALPGARLAWSQPCGADGSAVAWSRQWTNPRPEVEIRSLGLAYGPDRRGVPVLLALSAATAVGAR